MPLVVFRADGGSAIGSGHVMRCLALATVFAEYGWTIGFASTAETFASVRALAEGTLETLTLNASGNEAAWLAQRWPAGADILVVDHYGRDAVFERACRPWAKQILAIDDLADRPHDADMITDPGNSAEAYSQLAQPGCAILAGPQYAIVHPKFRNQRKQSLARREGHSVERVLVSFGQVDAPNATARAIEALAAIDFAGDIDVVLGGAAPNLADVRAKTGSRIHLHVDTDDMATLMRAADLAIGAGGGTSWERCCLGLPSIAVEIAGNQRGVIRMLSQSGAVLDAGKLDADAEARISGALRHLITDSLRYTAMAKNAAALVDGRGCIRIVLAMADAVAGKDGQVRMRLAEPDDEDWLLELQSKPETRRYANDPNAPSAAGHRASFRRRMHGAERILMIAELGGKRAGMLRLDRNDETYRVSIAVDPEFHRRGAGAAMLDFATRAVAGRALEAEVLPGNLPSQALFLSKGYRLISDRLYKRVPE